MLIGTQVDQFAGGEHLFVDFSKIWFFMILGFQTDLDFQDKQHCYLTQTANRCSRTHHNASWYSYQPTETMGMARKTAQGTNRHIMRSPIFRSKTLRFDPEVLALCSLPIFSELKIGRQSPIERSLYNFSAQSLQKKKLEGDWFRNRDFGYGGSASAYMKQIPSYIGSTFLDGLYNCLWPI